jgi:hypothetical protein
MNAKVQYFTNQYVISHGAKPRGRGSWAFQISAVNWHDGKGAVHFSPGAMTLTEAKQWFKPVAQKEATNYANAPHHIDVDILP